MKIMEIMSSPVVAIRPDEPVSHAKNLMLRHHIGHLVVIERGKNVGMLSIRDIAEHIDEISSTKHQRPIDFLQVSRLMSQKPMTAEPTTDIRKAAGLMLDHTVDSIVVSKNTRLVGILTKTDLTRYFVKSMKGRVKIGELMSTKVITVNRKSSFIHLVKLMKKHHVGRVVVVEGKKPLGIVSASDVVFAEIEKPAGGIEQRKVSYTRKPGRGERPKYRYVKYITPLTADDIMTQELITMGKNDDVVSAAESMLEHKIGGIPIVEEDALVGILTKTDITKAVAGLGE